MTDLFGGLPKHTPDNGRRGAHYIAPCGYAASPGTGPTGETCGSCKHLARGRRWAKCELVRGKWTRSRTTDVLVRAHACRRWERDA